MRSGYNYLNKLAQQPEEIPAPVRNSVLVFVIGETDASHQ